ncbi:MAG: DUF6472 family protein [Oscillospiraceae bacterium]
MSKKQIVSNCDLCENYIYDEELEQYLCLINLDEDEMSKFISYSFHNCPYYKIYDEYKIVQKQN